MHKYTGDRDTVFVLSGGAGRIVAAIPALEKYARLNPEDDFKVLIHGWDFLLYGNPELQDRVYNADQKGMFELVIKGRNMVTPEPYHKWSYYNQKASLAEAFDEEINATTDHSDLSSPKIYLAEEEIRKAKELIEEIKTKFKKDKIVVMQPFGQGAQVDEKGNFSDTTGRSLTQEAYVKLIENLPEKFGCIYFGPQPLMSKSDKISVNLGDQHMRLWAALINEADYFVGIDSLGQHLARAFDKPATVIMGPTFEKNVSYPDYEKFKFFRNEKVKAKYSPIRIGGVDSMIADMANASALRLDDQQIKNLASSIKTEVLG